MAEECWFQLTLGTTWSESTSNSFGIDAGVKYSISAGLWNIFSNELEVSASTGYDWTQTNTVTQSDAETYTVKVTVGPGTTAIIEQVVGRCGGEQHEAFS